MSQAASIDAQMLGIAGPTSPEIPGAQLKILPGNAGHYVLGKKALEVCRDGLGVDRAQIHKETEQAALDFLERV